MTRLKHLSVRHGLAFLALFIALGGTATAASKFIDGKNIKKGTVTSKQVRDRSLLARDFKRGQLPKGAQGNSGAAGTQGPAGAKGDKGDTGAAGTDGSNGAKGDKGDKGDTGAAGTNGTDGEDGATGPARVPTYGYVYNIGVQSVASEDTVEFDNNGALTPDLSHPPGSNAVVLSTPGVYKLTFTATLDTPGQMAVFVNGAPISGSTYGSYSQSLTGQVIIPLASGDTLTLVNHSSDTTVTLRTLAGGGQQNVNASMMIEMLG